MTIMMDELHCIGIELYELAVSQTYLLTSS